MDTEEDNAALTQHGGICSRRRLKKMKSQRDYGARRICGRRPDKDRSYCPHDDIYNRLWPVLGGPDRARAVRGVEVTWKSWKFCITVSASMNGS